MEVFFQCFNKVEQFNGMVVPDIVDLGRGKAGGRVRMVSRQAGFGSGTFAAIR